MRLIGLCGRSGSGKGVFASAARECGVAVIDCDKLYAEMVGGPSDCLTAIGEAFGYEYIREGRLDRKKMSELVFNDPSKLLLLNRITHSYVRAELAARVAALDPDSTVLFDAPTLFESGLNEECDLIVAVVASDRDCLERILLRDGIDRDSALLRLSNQAKNEFYIENADIVLYNEGSLEAFEADALEVAKKIAEGVL